MPRHFSLSIIAQALIMGLSGTAYAADAPTADTEKTDKNTALAKKTLDTVLVKAVVPENVATISAKELVRAGAQNIEDLTTYEPGVDMGTDNKRFGNNNFVIRGIGTEMQSNAIQMNLDGIPLPTAIQYTGTAFGAASQSADGLPRPRSSRDTVEFDTLKTVNIFKGGNGTAQGDGALAGSVNMQTYSPSDFLKDDKNHYFGLKYGYRSLYRSHGITATAAGQTGDLSGLIMLTHRKLSDTPEIDNTIYKQHDRVVDNSWFGSQKSKQNNVLIKGQWRAERHHADVSIEQFTRRSETQENDKYQKQHHDDITRRRYTLGYRYFPTDNLDLGVQLYHQNLRTHDNTDAQQMFDLIHRFSGNIQDRNRYQQRIHGIKADAHTLLQTGSVNHDLTAGVEYRNNRSERLLHSTITNEQYGISRTTLGRQFPNTERSIFAQYLQSQTTFGNGITLGLGLRHETERTQFEPDEIYSTRLRNSGTAVQPTFNNTRNSFWLPSIGLSVPFFKHWRASLAYRRGYRTPDFHMTGAGSGLYVPSEDFCGGQKIEGCTVGSYLHYLPNSDLKPEHSNNIEASLRYQSANLDASLSLFRSRYHNFIDARSTSYFSLADPKKCFGNNVCTEITYINGDTVVSQGWEAAFKWSMTQNWKLLGSLANVNAKRATSVMNPQAFDTLAVGDYPLHGNVGFAYESERWGISSHLRFAKKQTKSRKGADYFPVPGYGAVDLAAYWQPNKRVEINFGVNNLFNKRYWNVADIAERNQGLKSGDGIAYINAAAAPGRNYHFGMRLHF
ncbi:MAG: TonB-dependent receptor [Neisseria sp.]|nr:TonB-dependent receptor [Neisseria sp.]